MKHITYEYHPPSSLDARPGRKWSEKKDLSEWCNDNQLTVTCYALLVWLLFELAVFLYLFT